MLEKTCTKCGETLPATLGYFNKMEHGKHGLWAECKICSSKRKQEWRAANKEKIRESTRLYNEAHREEIQRYREANREKANERSRQWREENKERQCENSRRWTEENRERKAGYMRQWFAQNPERKKEHGRRRRSNPRNRVSNSISDGIRYSLKNGKEGHHWESLVGYTVDDLMAHLAPQFAKGMTWDNYGKWHVDHIRPISHFNFESYTDTEFKECWSLWNLQPLWAKENLCKQDKCENPPLPLLSLSEG